MKGRKDEGGKGRQKEEKNKVKKKEKNTFYQRVKLKTKKGQKLPLF